MSRILFSGGLRRKSLMMALVFALVLAALPAALFAAPASDHDRGCYGNCYVVKAGDTLSQIAKNYGVNYHDLARINGISDPSLIYVGQVLRIPPRGHYPDHDYKKDDHKHDYKDDYKKDDHKKDDYKHGHKDDCGCDYDKKSHDKKDDGKKGHGKKDDDSYSGYLYGSHYESYVLVDEYHYGYEFDGSGSHGYDHHKK
jgi:LysM repeat protein